MTTAGGVSIAQFRGCAEGATSKLGPFLLDSASRERLEHVGVDLRDGAFLRRAREPTRPLLTALTLDGGHTADPPEGDEGVNGCPGCAGAVVERLGEKKGAFRFDVRAAGVVGGQERLAQHKQEVAQAVRVFRVEDLLHADGLVQEPHGLAGVKDCHRAYSRPLAVLDRLAQVGWSDE